MSKTKAGGSTRNGRDSESKRLGTKVFDGQDISAGSIVIRQRGTKNPPRRECLQRWGRHSFCKNRWSSQVFFKEW